MSSKERAFGDFRRLPGTILLSPLALSCVVVIVVNDLWLKRAHPGVLSGKLSDAGLCILLPLFLGAMLQWADFLARRFSLRLPGTERAREACACLVGAAYFTLVKVWPLATHAHVALLSLLVPSHRFRAVTDPTDLVVLPLVLVAWRAMGRWRDPAKARTV